MTEKQKRSADVFTLVEARFTDAANTYAASIRNARFLLEDAQRKSKSRAADATARQHMLEAEVDRNFENDKLRKYLVSQVVAARSETENGSALTIRERAQIVDSIDAAGAALDDLRRVHANMGEAIAAAEKQLAAVEYELSAFRSPAPIPADAQTAPLPDELRVRLCEIFNFRLPAGATLADALTAQRERAADEGAARLAEWVAYQREGAQP